MLTKFTHKMIFKTLLLPVLMSIMSLAIVFVLYICFSGNNIFLLILLPLFLSGILVIVDYFFQKNIRFFKTALFIYNCSFNYQDDNDSKVKKLLLRQFLIQNLHEIYTEKFFNEYYNLIKYTLNDTDEEYIEKFRVYIPIDKIREIEKLLLPKGERTC